MNNAHHLDTLLGALETDHTGISLTVHQNAEDHCTMRAMQLAALLRLVSGVGFDSFLSATTPTKDGVLWLASSLADEVQRLLPLVSAEAACSNDLLREQRAQEAS